MAFMLGFMMFSGTIMVRAEESYTFAVVPQFEQRKLFAIWKPIVDELTRRSGIKLNLVATLTVPEFERELAKGSFDFVYANPYHILREVPRQGYIPLVRDKAPLRGILVVRKDNPVKSPGELDGQRLAIPSFNALGASLLIRADLEQLFKVRMIPVNVKTHSSVYLNVANGLAAAGGGVEKTFHEQEQSVQDLLRVLHVTREMPSHPVAAHPRTPPAVRKAIQRAFLELAGTENGRQLLEHVPMAEVITTSINDYLPMRAWGLDTYWVE
jgi:phosphonate transport system substrate-binding protein